jgi:hypothetical protein
MAEKKEVMTREEEAAAVAELRARGCKAWTFAELLEQHNALFAELTASMRRLSESEQRIILRRPELNALYTRIVETLNQWPRDKREVVLARLRAISPALAEHVSRLELS